MKISVNYKKKRFLNLFDTHLGLHLSDLLIVNWSSRRGLSETFELARAQLVRVDTFEHVDQRLAHDVGCLLKQHN